MFNKLKQYKDLRDQAKKVQNELSEVTVHSDAWGGKVNMVMDGNQKVMSIDIDAELLQTENKEKLEKSLADCFNDAVKKAQRSMVQKMQKGDFKLPDLPGFGKDKKE